MRLAQFINDNMEAILVEWEAFVKTLPPGQEMTSAALRDDAEDMLQFVAFDMESAQSETESETKSRGEKPSEEDTPAQTHGRLRLMQAFDLVQMVSEFRALRATVIRLWSAQAGPAMPAGMPDLIRFNESIDQILAESVHRYAGDMERSRELLLAVLGHDLRNPLSSVRMSAEALSRTALNSRQHELASNIVRGSERMRNMVRDLLDFTRTRLGAKLVMSAERCDLAEVCRNIADETRSAHPDRSVTVNSSGDCVGHWDKDRMAQLVSNLVGNAVEHGNEDTAVDIDVLGREPDAVYLVVQNQGPPIPLARRASMFDPLNRTPAATDRGIAGSLGLGLYIVNEIAAAHGGEIRLLNSDEAGTRFEVRLPRGMEGGGPSPDAP